MHPPDLGGERFRLEEREIKRRGRVFWHLFSSDVWAVSSVTHLSSVNNSFDRTHVEFHIRPTAIYIVKLR
jgi:hypothetical protein